ncbi:hypothetical protein V1517DRAFT_209717 [Lipomyces orientalis]|uniref:Uncharacterized protein n=1 Tax=Lipomyces orientalis TaxID=1233043 RepID=A0ACC3THF1_9ASCO
MFNPSQFQGMPGAPGAPGNMHLMPNNTGMDFGLPGIQALQARMMPQIGGQAGAPNGGPGGPSLAGNNKISWAITKAEKKIFDDIFDAWDGLGRGFISGETAVEILGQSGLQRDDLEKIWTLSDPEDRGRLNKSEFSVAMHLVYRRLNGYPIPAHLPPELIPPSTRNLSQSVSTLKSMLKSEADQRRSNTLIPQATGVSYLKAHSFRDPINTSPKKDATVFKNNDDEASLYVSSARRRNGGSRGATSSPSPSVSSVGSGKELSKGETLESLRKAIREKQILLNAIDAEDDFAFNEDLYLSSRDRDEADDLIRKVRHIQEDIDDYTSSAPSTNVNAEKAALRNQLQYLADRLPVLVGRARGIGNKISDAKLELFRIRDSKAHPGAQVIGTGPGGRVTEADKRKARSLAILQARMAALTGRPASVDSGGDDEQAAEVRLAEETDKIRVEKDQNEQMIRDVEESVRAVQDSLEGLLKETRQDFKVERERQLFEEGIGAEDEVRDLILEIQRRKARSEPRITSRLASNSSEPSRGSRSSPMETAYSNGSSAPLSASPAPLTSTPSGPSATSSKPGSGSFYAQFRTPEERAAWIKSEAERRMNERLAALGISRPAKGADSSSAFSAPTPSTPAPESQANAFSPPGPPSQPSSESRRALSPAPKPAAPEHRSNSIFSEPVTKSQAHYQTPARAPASRNPFPVQDDFYYDSSKPTAPRYAEVDFSQSETSPERPSAIVPAVEVAKVASPTISEPPKPDFYAAQSEVRPQMTSPVPPLSAGRIHVDAFAAPPIPREPSPKPAMQPPVQATMPSVPSASSTSSAAALPNQATLDAQRRYQRGHGDDDDDWSVVPSESDSSDDEGPSPVGGSGPKKPSPTDLASLLFGSMAPQSSLVPSNNQSSAATSTSRGTPYETAATSPAPPAPPALPSVGVPSPSLPDGFGGAVAPPPPPPAPIFGVPMPEAPNPSVAPPIGAGTVGGLPDRSALLGQIAAGRQLKKVQTIDKSQISTVGRVL